MKNTFEEAVLKSVMWWSEKAFKTAFNQNNGDDSPQGGFAFALMNMLSMKAQDAVTPDKIKKFEDKLTEILMEEGPGYRRLEVDYGPSKMLADACEFAGIDGSCLPIKSSTSIAADDFTVRAYYQYGGRQEIL